MVQSCIGQLFGNKYDFRTHQNGKDLIDSNTLIGLEVELENVQNNLDFPTMHASPYWKKDHDHSLRGPAVEWKFAMPLRGADVETAIKELEQDVILHAQPVKSDRTSTHVHLDVNTLSKAELYRFILTSIMVERILYKYAGPHRANSIFCVPFYKAESGIEDISAFLENPAGLRLNLRFLLSNDMRYGGINLSSITQYGTVEYRMLDSEWQYDKLIEWINLLLSIRKYALNLDKPIIEVHKDLSKWGMTKLVDDIFGPYADRLRYPGMDRDILQGVRLAQQIEYSNTNLNLVWNLAPLVDRTRLTIKKGTHKHFFARRRKTTTKKKTQPGPAHFNQEQFANLIAGNGMNPPEGWVQMYVDHPQADEDEPV